MYVFIETERQHDLEFKFEADKRSKLVKSYLHESDLFMDCIDSATDCSINNNYEKAKRFIIEAENHLNKQKSIFKEMNDEDYEK